MVAAHAVTVDVVMACTDMALYSHGLYSHGLYSYTHSQGDVELHTRAVERARDCGGLKVRQRLVIDVQPVCLCAAVAISSQVRNMRLHFRDVASVRFGSA